MPQPNWDSEHINQPSAYIRKSIVYDYIWTQSQGNVYIIIRDNLKSSLLLLLFLLSLVHIQPLGYDRLSIPGRGCPAPNVLATHCYPSPVPCPNLASAPGVQVVK